MSYEVQGKSITETPEEINDIEVQGVSQSTFGTQVKFNKVNYQPKTFDMTRKYINNGKDLVDPRTMTRMFVPKVIPVETTHSFKTFRNFYSDKNTKPIWLLANKSTNNYRVDCEKNML